MNRVRAAFIVLGLLVCFAVFGHISVANVTKNHLQQLQEAEQAVLRQDYVSAGEHLDALKEYCESCEPLLTLLVRRDLFNSLRTSISGLDAYANTQYRNDLLMELDRTRAQVLALHQQYFSFI